MDYSYFTTPTSYDQQQQQQQAAVNNQLNAEYVKSATRSLYTSTLLTPPPLSQQQQQQTMSTPPPSLGVAGHHLYTSHTNLGPPGLAAATQYLKLAQPLNSGASTAPPLPLQQQQLNYVTYNLDDLKLTSGGGVGGGGSVVHPVTNGISNVSNGSQMLTNGVYSSLGSLAHSGTRSTI